MRPVLSEPDLSERIHDSVLEAICSGELKAGDYADIVIFDPMMISDHATFDKPQQYATGMRDVFVNGVQVLRDGEHTGAKPGVFVRGPGWTGWTTSAR